uniref:Uncharacterized protein n=1 Tax=Rhizophora mucronata TaxID=61149 RepID=A0A2P2NVU8_RHIMU
MQHIYRCLPSPGCHESSPSHIPFLRTLRRYFLCNHIEIVFGNSNIYQTYNKQYAPLLPKQKNRK